MLTFWHKIFFLNPQKIQIKIRILKGQHETYYACLSCPIQICILVNLLCVTLSSLTRQFNMCITPTFCTARADWQWNQQNVLAGHTAWNGTKLCDPVCSHRSAVKSTRLCTPPTLPVRLAVKIHGCCRKTNVTAEVLLNSSGRAQQAIALYEFFIMPIICYVFTAFHDHFQYKTVVQNCWEKTTTIKESTWQGMKHFNRLASQLYFWTRHSVVKMQGYTESKHWPPQRHADTRHVSTAQQGLTNTADRQQVSWASH